MTTNLKAYGPWLVFIAAMLWATDAPFRAALTENLTSDFIVLMEHAIAVTLLLPVLYVHAHEFDRLQARDWVIIIIIGVGGSALALLAFTESFNYMNPSVVILLQKLQPLIAIYLAVAFLSERITKQFWVWTGLALVSAYFISFPGLVPQVYEGEVFNPHVIGVLLALSAAILWGAATVLGKYMLSSLSFQAMTAIRFLIAFLFLLMLSGVNGSFAQVGILTLTDVLYIGIIGITSGVVAMYIYYRGLTASKASVATLAELGFPFAAVIVNYMFLDAALSTVQLLAMLVLVYAVYRLSGVNLKST